ncbi:MAG: succinate dehydrogenase assembly factor 2 [Sphingomonadaceae bacterium]|uniref:FAD assembly factor SdhE n=1 Tax=Thermaurantiacus sp. TaxID=2820283 RepID=UPI00298F0D3E|nr:succinate dehydrogenase assembly factor 2 [Thermaurantiacus sp.]MCS6986171.1 succinate dehydrogenase assembly factor 2 [Sphingomonadaceae bacterium]MDW8414603.1 succinate dehydrogenase assembly factor 2 [Thermaurantiacus sp.]
MRDVTTEAARRRARWRAHHRGLREADLVLGGFADRHLAAMGRDELAWFEALLAEADHDILAWAFGLSPPPPELAGPLMERLRALDYLALPAAGRP